MAGFTDVETNKIYDSMQNAKAGVPGSNFKSSQYTGQSTAPNFGGGTGGYDPANPFKQGVGGSPYDAERQKAMDQAQDAGAQGMDAMTRRYAAMGGLNSGSAVKGQQEAARQARQEGEQSVAGINAHEGDNVFQARNQALQAAQMQQQNQQFGASYGQAEEEMGLKAHQQELDAQANAVNEALAAHQAGHSGGVFGGGGIAGLGF